MQLHYSVPNIVVIGVPDVAALNRVLVKLRANQIPHHSWHEPDFDFGFTAIATAPLDDSQRAVLANYRLYSGGVNVTTCGFTPDSAANSPVVSNRTSASKAEGVGENPTGRAN